MRTIHVIPCVFVLLLACNLHGQHSPITSQYLFNGLLINPAYAGSRDALTANLTHRQQWVGFEGAPVTQVLSVHAPVGKRRVGLGILVTNDRIGVSRETGVFSNYAYRIKFPTGKLAFGLGAGFTAQRTNWQDVVTQEQQDVSFQGGTNGVLRPEFSAGIYYYARSFFAGASLPFLLTQDHFAGDQGAVISRTRSEMQPMFTAGCLIPASSQLKVKPSTLIRYRPESGLQADLSAHLIIKDALWLGLAYRTSDAVIGMVELLPTPQWRIGYAYDTGISKLGPYHLGSHGLMVQYEFGYRIKARDPRYF